MCAHGHRAANNLAHQIPHTMHALFPDRAPHGRGNRKSTEQLAQVLARNPSIRVARSVARRDIEHPVVTEYEAATVVSLRVPFDDDVFRECVALARRLALHRITRNAVRPRKLPGSTMGEHKQMAIGSIPRMEREAVNQPVADHQKPKGMDGPNE